MTLRRLLFVSLLALGTWACSDATTAIDAAQTFPDAEIALDAPGADAGAPDAVADAAADAAPIVDVGPSPDAMVDAGGAADTGPRVSPCPVPVPQTPVALDAPGPFKVGARSATVAGIWTEIWYPAAAGSELGATPAAYDIRQELPPAERGKIPDEANPLQGCDCYRDLPIETQAGVFPVIIFVHGTAAFRTQSLSLMTHWASRGFVVLAGTHTGLKLADVLNGNFIGDPVADVQALLRAVRNPSGPLAFLAGTADASRIALTGHSAGGGTIAGLGNEAGVLALIPMASGGSAPDNYGPTTLVLAAVDDGVVPYMRTLRSYEASPGPKWFVGLTGAGHLAFSDLCLIGRDQGGILAVAQRYGVAVNALVARLAQDGCGPMNLSPERGLEIIRFASTAVLEGHLQCKATRDPLLADLRTRYPEVGELRDGR